MALGEAALPLILTGKLRAEPLPRGRGVEGVGGGGDPGVQAAAPVSVRKASW